MTALTRMKLVVNTVAKNGGPNMGSPSETITMSAVISDVEGSPNKQWSKWTPEANLRYTVTNEALFGAMKPGDYFFVDLIPCDKDAI